MRDRLDERFQQCPRWLSRIEDVYHREPAFLIALPIRSPNHRNFALPCGASKATIGLGE